MNDLQPVPSFFRELRRRGVVRVAVVYAAAGWSLIEVSDVVLPRLTLPDWSVTLVVVLVLLGLPLALILAWAYDLTPEGVRVDAGGTRPGARLGVGTWLAVGLALGLGFGAGFLARRDGVTARTLSSIAVLPFQDLSPQADQAYFSEGIAEELINALARIPALRVIGRTSVVALRDRDADAREIGDELGVDLVLDGSVRRDGQAVRIGAQLIDASTGAVVWSERYDRRMASIFTLQDEITGAIVTAIEADGRLDVRGPADPERVDAHDLYLLGLSAWHRRNYRALLQARDYFERATRIDPEYAPAHAGLALTRALLPYFAPPGEAVDLDASSAATRAEARRALELDPSSAEAHAALSQAALILDWDVPTAHREIRRALELRPGYATAWQWYAEVLGIEGRLDEATDAARRARELDPLAPAPADIEVTLLHARGRAAEALQETRRLRALYPDVSLFDDLMVLIGFSEADYALVREANAGATDDVYLAALEEAARLLAEDPDSQRARSLLEDVLDGVPESRLHVAAMAFVGLGQYDLAVTAIERAAASRAAPGLPYVFMYTQTAPIRQDPRFVRVMRRIGLDPDAD